MLFLKEEYKERLKKVQKSMQNKGIELLIPQDTNNMNYLTGYDAWSFYYAQCVIVTCKEGISSVLDAHRNIKIYTASIDSHLNEKNILSLD